MSFTTPSSPNQSLSDDVLCFTPPSTFSLLSGLDSACLDSIPDMPRRTIVSLTTTPRALFQEFDAEAVQTSPIQEERTVYFLKIFYREVQQLITSAFCNHMNKYDVQTGLANIFSSFYHRNCYFDLAKIDRFVLFFTSMFNNEVYLLIDKAFLHQMCEEVVQAELMALYNSFEHRVYHPEPGQSCE